LISCVAAATRGFTFIRDPALKGRAEFIGPLPRLANCERERGLLPAQPV